MSKRIVYIYFLVGFLFTSCIPTKDLIYLQDKGNSSKEIISEVQSKPYRLQLNDIISIKIKALDNKLVEIFNNSNTNSNTQQMLTSDQLYFSGYSIDDHGNIRMPLIGEINVLGFTLDEVRTKIEEKLLADYFRKEAELFIDVKLAGFKVTVNGEVKSPGTKVLYVNSLNIMEAIANSGDIADEGDRKDVKVIRKLPQGTETFSIDLTDKLAMNSPVYNLQPNDYIYVKPLKQKTWGTGKTGVESIRTIVTVISLATTAYILINR